MRLLTARMLVPAQATAAIVALLLAAMWPPASGALLLVPLPHARAAAARIALEGGATLVAAGPLPGSLVVVGERARIAAGHGGWDVLITAAPPAGCRAPRLQERRG